MFKCTHFSCLRPQKAFCRSRPIRSHGSSACYWSDRAALEWTGWGRRGIRPAFGRLFWRTSTGRSCRLRCRAASWRYPTKMRDKTIELSSFECSLLSKFKFEGRKSGRGVIDKWPRWKIKQRQSVTGMWRNVFFTPQRPHLQLVHNVLVDRQFTVGYHLHVIEDFAKLWVQTVQACDLASNALRQGGYRGVFDVTKQMLHTNFLCFFSTDIGRQMFKSLPCWGAILKKKFSLWHVK